MPYSAVTQPRACPLSHGGRRSSRVAVTRTWVSPNFTKQEPSAYFTTPRSSETARSSSGCRRLGRISFSCSAREGALGMFLEHEPEKASPVRNDRVRSDGRRPCAGFSLIPDQNPISSNLVSVTLLLIRAAVASCHAV